MVKAKDLLKDSTLAEKEEPKKSLHEDDKVTAAYEEINRKLSAIRAGTKVDEEETEEPEKETKDDMDEKIVDDDQEDQIDPLDDETVEDEKEVKVADPEDAEKEVEAPLTPQKTFEPAEMEPAAARQFTTKNIEMNEDVPKKDDGAFDSLDDLADSEGSNGATNNSQKFDEPEERPRGMEEENVDIPPLNSARPRYNFSDPASRRSPGMDSGTPEFNPRGGYSSRHNNNNAFGQDFQHRSRGRSSSLFQLLILLLIGAGVIGGTVYFLKNQFQGNGGAPSSTPAPSQTSALPTAEPSPTVAPLNRANFKLRVLNGTSTTGLAGTVSDKLKGLGYGIERTGNATNSAFEKTIVRVKENQASLSGQLIQDLAPDYTPDVQITLKATDPVDSEIILGEK